jgi:hypothetical protein
MKQAEAVVAVNRANEAVHRPARNVYGRDMDGRLVVGGVEEDLTGRETGGLFPDLAASDLIGKTFQKHIESIWT